MDLFLRTWFWLFDTLPIEAARAGNFFSMLSLLLFRQGILINSSTGEKSQDLEILANWKLVSKKLLKNQSDILNVQLTASSPVFIFLRYFNFEPSFKLRWCRARDLFGSQMPVTAGGFELKISCIWSSYQTH